VLQRTIKQDPQSRHRSSTATAGPDCSRCVAEYAQTHRRRELGPSILPDMPDIRVGGNGTTWLGESRRCSFGYRWRSRWLTFLGVMALLTVPFDALGQSTPATSGMSNLTATTVELFIDPNSNARMQADKWRES